MNLVEIVSKDLVEICHHIHIYLHLVEICAIICTYTSRLLYVRKLMTHGLDVDWATWLCLEPYDHSNTGDREPHDVL